ncbi:transcriptional regulator [Saccharopolyspora subtropica]|uniref:LysR substrate-binding domain-containing protein n=1 Tax=Saccharopolyspora thermophila TaxID=89367 RepID=A0A917JNI1_9PSEU|nr:LysR substrate-binding domain-containing protein [Saccharopolyspora subtropica]GGI75402.1 transcriptional regulator [Saccharopolyspora subtropica]
MDLLPLRYFQVVARHEHISRAAAELHVSQPSLSRTIARLEAELGVPLFDRQGRHVRLNRFGAAFLRRVDRALGELDDARRELADEAGEQRGTVAVASETLLTLIDPLTRFRAAHPGIDVRLYQSSAEVMWQRLRRGEVDVCLASQPADPSLETTEVLREEVLLAVPLGHRLAGRTSCHVEELAGEPFITTSPGYWQRDLTDRVFAAAGLTPTISFECDEPGVTAYLIRAGLGIGLIPEMARRLAPHEPIAYLHLQAPTCHRVLSFVRRREAYLSAAVRVFREHVTESLRGGRSAR